MGLHRGRAGTSTKVKPEGAIGLTNVLLQTPVVISQAGLYLARMMHRPGSILDRNRRKRRQRE